MLGLATSYHFDILIHLKYLSSQYNLEETEHIVCIIGSNRITVQFFEVTYPEINMK